MDSIALLNMPLNVDTEEIIYKLRNLKMVQSQMFEESFKNYQQMAELVKIQNQIENQMHSTSRKQQFKEIQQSISEDYHQSILQESKQQEAQIQELEMKTQQLERENKNLQEESTEKSKLFQDLLNSKYTDSLQMPFQRITSPGQISQYYYNSEEDILIQSENNNPIPNLKIYSIEKRSLATNIHSNSVKLPFSCFSALSDKLVWCTENGTDVEIWTFNKPPQPLRRLGIISAHIDTITLLQFITPKLFVSSSQKGILKLWNVETQQLIKSFRLTSQITCCQLLDKRIIANNTQQLENSNTAQIIAGFSDGVIRILEFTGINSDQLGNIQYEVIYQQSINEKNHKAPEIDCISIAFPLHDPKKQIQNQVQINDILIGASLTPEPDNIYIVVPYKYKVFNIQNTVKTYRNQNKNKQFTLTKQHLIAGSFDGQIHVWDISDLTHPLKYSTTPQLKVKFSSPTLYAVPILITSYDQIKDTLIIGDSQGNVLKWSNFIQYVNKK